MTPRYWEGSSSSCLFVCNPRLRELTVAFIRNEIDCRCGNKNPKKTPREYLATQFMTTIDGNDYPALVYSDAVLGPEKIIIMCASDYPYQAELCEASDFVNPAPLPGADLGKIARGNAERVSHVRVA